MARPTRKQTLLKEKAIEEAFDELKELTTPLINRVINDRIVDLANENYEGQLDSNISYTSLRAPTNEKFKEIKAKAGKFKEEHKKNKNIVPKKAKKEVASLKRQRDDLIEEVVKYEHKFLELSEETEELKKAIKTLKRDNLRLMKKLDGLQA